MIFLEKAVSDGFRPPFSAIWPHFQPNGIAVIGFGFFLCYFAPEIKNRTDMEIVIIEKKAFEDFIQTVEYFISRITSMDARTEDKQPEQWLTRLTCTQVFSWTAARSIRYGNRANCHSRSSSTGCTTRQRTWKLLLTDWRRSPLRVRKQK